MNHFKTLPINDTSYNITKSIYVFIYLEIFSGAKVRITDATVFRIDSITFRLMFEGGEHTHN